MRIVRFLGCLKEVRLWDHEFLREFRFYDSFMNDTNYKCI